MSFPHELELNHILIPLSAEWIASVIVGEAHFADNEACN